MNRTLWLVTAFLAVGVCISGGRAAGATLRAPEQLIMETRRCSYYSRCKPFEELMRWKGLIAPTLVANLSSRNYATRHFMARGLKQLGLDAVPHLIKGLESTTTAIRRKCIVLLGEIGNHRALMPLLKLLKRSGYYERASIIGALGQLGDRRAVPILLGYLKGSNRRYKKAAAKAFSMMPHISAIPELIKMLQVRQLQSVATQALGAIRSKKAAPHLMRLLEAHIKKRYYYWQLSEIVQAIGKIGVTTAEPFLIKLLTHRSSSVRSRAIVALGMLKSKKALPLIRKQIADRYYRIRMAANVALIAMGKHPNGLKELFRLATDYSSTTRSLAIQMLGRVNNKKSIAFLIERLEKERYSFVRRQILQSLRKITGRNFGENVEHWRIWAKVGNLS